MIFYRYDWMLEKDSLRNIQRIFPGESEKAFECVALETTKNEDGYHILPLIVLVRGDDEMSEIHELTQDFLAPDSWYEVYEDDFHLGDDLNDPIAMSLPRIKHYRNLAIANTSKKY